MKVSSREQTTNTLAIVFISSASQIWQRRRSRNIRASKKSYWKYTKPVLCLALNLFHICPANYSYIAKDLINNDSLKSDALQTCRFETALQSTLEKTNWHTGSQSVFNVT
jgi:5-methylthioribose kinase